MRHPCCNWRESCLTACRTLETRPVKDGPSWRDSAEPASGVRPSLNSHSPPFVLRHNTSAESLMDFDLDLAAQPLWSEEPHQRCAVSSLIRRTAVKLRDTPSDAPLHPPLPPLGSLRSRQYPRYLCVPPPLALPFREIESGSLQPLQPRQESEVWSELICQKTQTIASAVTAVATEIEMD